MAEKAINIKVDETLYKEVKFRVVELDMTLKEYIINLIKKDLAEKDGK